MTAKASEPMSSPRVTWRHAVRLMLVAGLAFSGACARIHENARVTHALQQAVSRTTSDVEATKSALLQALSRRQYAALAEWLVDSAVLVLPTGDSIQSGRAIVAALAPLGIDNLTFDDADRTPCADGAFESGTYVLTRRPEPFAPARVSAGDYTIHWRTTGERLRVDRIALFAHRDKKAEGYRPCASLHKPLVLRSRFALSVSPFGGQFDYATQAGLRARAEAEGWKPSTPAERTNEPQPPRISTQRANVFITLQANLLPIGIEASGSLLPVTGGVFGFNDTFDSGLTQRFEAREAYVIFSFLRGGHRLGVGPALVSTKWISMEERMGRFFPGPERWPTTATGFYLGPFESRTNALGLMTQYMFRIPNGTNRILELGARYRLVSGKAAGVHAYKGGSVSQNGAFGVVSLGRVF